jgi:[ribosomal protein S5]-alanine N-acetyltransferase
MRLGNEEIHSDFSGRPISIFKCTPRAVTGVSRPDAPPQLPPLNLKPSFHGSNDGSMIFPQLETDRLVLRPIGMDDATDLYFISQSLSHLEDYGGFIIPSLAMAIKRVDEMKRDWEQCQGIRWGISMKAQSDGDRDGSELNRRTHMTRLIGSLGFWRVDKRHYSAEVGYELSPSMWRRGIMPEALKAVVKFGLEVMGLNAIEASIDPRNIASKRVLEKAGFASEGLFKRDYYDTGTAAFQDTMKLRILSPMDIIDIAREKAAVP